MTRQPPTLAAASRRPGSALAAAVAGCQAGVAVPGAGPAGHGARGGRG
jgi:hypothetical protein